jgi:hypothetical protein
MEDDVLALYKVANKDIVDIIEEFNLTSTTRERGTVYKRYYLYNVLTRRRYLTTSMTGKFFGKDHSSVIHGLKQHEFWWKIKDKGYLSQVNIIHEALKNEKIDDGNYNIEIKHLGEEETKVIITGNFDWRVLEKLPSKMTKEELTKMFKEHGKNERSIHSNNE